jgi:mRNA-degrading endonuclease toxin of MazEF toxin-antitoxin module
MDPLFSEMYPALKEIVAVNSRLPDVVSVTITNADNLIVAATEDLIIGKEYKTEIVDGKISFEFSVDIDPVKLDERKTEIEEDFVEQIDKEIETNIRKGVRK